MAVVLGSRVFAGPVKEIGWGRIDLTEAGRNSCLNPLAQKDGAVLHWHGDTFELPEGATRLASNNHYQNQAFSHGANALALQFHAEADPSKLENWFVGHAGELSGAGVSVPELRAMTNTVAAGMEERAARIFEPWLKAIAPGI